MRSSRGRERARERASWRRERALVRRRLAAPPPSYLSGPSDDPDDGVPFNTDGADSPAGDRSGKRRTRLRLALAAVPLIVAVVLFAVIGQGSGPAPDQDTADAQDTVRAQDTAPAEDSAMAKDFAIGGAPPVPASGPGATESTGPPTAQDAAAAAGVLPGLDMAEIVPGRGVDEATVGVDSAHAGGHEAAGTDAADVATLPVPVAPSGHRPVALRVADPAAMSLVAVGTRVDVVGMDGTVLAERLEVLQDRSPGMGSVVVLAVPDSAAPALAADALSREVTVILSG